MAPIKIVPEDRGFQAWVDRNEKSIAIFALGALFGIIITIVIIAW
jgi:hypothetical protein